MAKKASVFKPVTHVLEVSLPWYGFITQYLDACEVPDDIKQFPTPEAAWKGASAERMEWFLDALGINYYTEKVSFADDDFSYEAAADQYRKTHPMPRKALVLMNRYARQKMTFDAVYDGDGNSVAFRVRKGR